MSDTYDGETLDEAKARIRREIADERKGIKKRREGEVL